MIFIFFKSCHPPWTLNTKTAFSTASEISPHSPNATHHHEGKGGNGGNVLIDMTHAGPAEVYRFISKEAPIEDHKIVAWQN